MNPPLRSVFPEGQRDSLQEALLAALGVYPPTADGAPSGATAGDGGEVAADPDAMAATQLRALLAAWARLDDRARAALLQSAEALARR